MGRKEEDIATMMQIEVNIRTQTGSTYFYGNVFI